ncbi:MAG TPA: ATP-binding cassette domain-containing protein, partial [Solirubrobacteraceae bacterium]|nr:ATP-binding cassette domain-containing protein [Solirubrobacteraceae bacterium]
MRLATDSGAPAGNGSAPPSASASVLVRGLKKSYGELEAVRGIDFDVAPGEVFGFLGPNGAGKSTTISMLCTLVRPTGGYAQVAGHDVVRERDAVRRSIGLVFQDTTLDGYLTAEQNMRLHAELRRLGAPVEDDDQFNRFDEADNASDLWEEEFEEGREQDLRDQLAAV